MAVQSFPSYFLASSCKGKPDRPLVPQGSATAIGRIAKRRKQQWHVVVVRLGHRKADRDDIQERLRKVLRKWFERKLVVVENFDATGDDGEVTAINHLQTTVS